MNHRFVIILVLLLLPALATARWDYPNAVGQLCFNVSNANAGVGLESDPFYNIITTNVTKNATFWASGNVYQADYPAERRLLDVFVTADDGTNVYLILPEVRNQTAGTKDFYCIYEGDQNRTSPQRIAPFGLGFDTKTEWDRLNTNSSAGFTTTWDSGQGIVNVTAPGGFALQNASAPSSAIDPFILAKLSAISVDATTNTSVIGVWSGFNNLVQNTSLFPSIGFGLGQQGGNTVQGFYTTRSSLGALQSGYNIYESSSHAGVTYNDSGRVFDANHALVLQQVINNTGTSFGIVKYTTLAYVRNASASFDWAIAGRGYKGVPSDWAATNVAYDFIDTNIVFVSPAFDGVYSVNDPVIESVQYQQAYDNCTLTLNGNSVNNYTGISAFQQTNDVLDEAQIVNGDNELKVSCFDGGVESHRFWYFTRSGASAEQLFMDAFDFNITSGCVSATNAELTKCTEAYNLNQLYNFSAVICPNLNTSVSFSCLSGAGIANSTKNGFTIFFAPGSYSYANNIDVEHIGAVFNYQASPITPGIEVINGTSFVYIPAQTKDRDCSIFYSSNVSGCSWGNGFILNNGSIVVSDKLNNWFITGGTGLPIFNINYSQTVINVAVQYISNNTANGPFSVGMFERVNCGVQNGSYVVHIQNTLAQTFTILTIGNVSSLNFTATTPLLTQTIPLSGLSLVQISVGDTVLCRFGGETTLLLPDFGAASLFAIHAYPILSWVLILFMGILGAILPFSLFALVLFNDAYQILNVTDVALVVVLAALAGLVNNATSVERGIKHLIIVLAIATVYIIALSRYDTSGTFTNDIIGAQDLFSGFQLLASSNQDLVSFVLNTGLFIGALFKLVLFIPASFVNLLFHALTVISPTLATAAAPVIGPNSILMLGIMLFFYIKAYEVLANRFRGV